MGYKGIEEPYTEIYWVRLFPKGHSGEIARTIVLLVANGNENENENMTGCIFDLNGASYLRT